MGLFLLLPEISCVCAVYSFEVMGDIFILFFIFTSQSFFRYFFQVGVKLHLVHHLVQSIS
jgi:hypothetical protein